jgi:predicted HAD superfamily Cof-like phosphohydrolase
MTKKTTREQVGEFHTSFRAPIRTELTALTVSERLLRGSLLLEETLEFFKASGLYLTIKQGEPLLVHHMEDVTDILVLEHIEGSIQDPVEMADGLGDINYIIHGTAHCLGINLDAVTSEIHDSNMSKLDYDGQPIINGVTPGYEGDHEHLHLADDGFNPKLPIGKVIKGPNYRKPNIAKVIGWHGGIDVGYAFDKGL